MSKTQAEFEESTHYGGKASVKFYPKAHFYSVTDPDMKFKNQRMGGATSLTGTMAKGQGLMLYPMYEMKKWLKQYFRTTTFEDVFDEQRSLEELLKEAAGAHTKKSDRGKSVGTDAHAWVEMYLREYLRVQELWETMPPQDGLPMTTKFRDENFTVPDIPSVPELAAMLKTSYITMFRNTAPKNFEDYKTIPKLLLRDAEIQEAIYTEAVMLNKSTTAAKAWFDRHEIYVHGTEDTVYSRKLLICGKYDADISVTCSERCNWCYVNGDDDQVAAILNDHGPDFKYTGRYIADFKSTNASSSAPKGVYPEYLAQCGVYDYAKTEEFPDIKYDGHLILNGSKNEGTFASHFSFERDRNCAWAVTLADLKEFQFTAAKEVSSSA